MAGTMIEVASRGDAIPAYLTLPPSGCGPGVIVIQEWWGLIPHVKAVADRFAAEGFVTLTPDLYRGTAPSEPDEADKLLMEMRIDEAANDLGGAVGTLLSMSETVGTRVGAVGFRMGGELAIKLATIRPEVGAVVSWYGFPRQGLSWDLGSIQGAVLGHSAENDDVANRELAQNLERDLLDDGVPAMFYVYPAATHAFFDDDRDDDRAGADDREAAELSWQRTVEFLHEQLGREPPGREGAGPPRGGHRAGGRVGTSGTGRPAPPHTDTMRSEGE
jgi:carboxymethylenebutenolidase